METQALSALLSQNSYPGRGILAGLTPDGRRAAAAYFIMGRSENSRNRVFRPEGEDIVIFPFDESRVRDPSLILYAPVRALPGRLILANGDHADTIREHLLRGDTFENALRTRSFEPDAPHFTPRISALLDLQGEYRCKMSILKRGGAEGAPCHRFTFDLAPVPGRCYFIHTYRRDGDPLPSYEGEAETVSLGDDPDQWTRDLWNSLDANNRISLFVRFIDLKTLRAESRVVNRFR